MEDWKRKEDREKDGNRKEMEEYGSSDQLCPISERDDAKCSLVNQS